MQRPLLICDADEVLVQFARPLEQFLFSQDHELRLDSFALTGNIRHRHTGDVANGEQVTRFIHDYFEAHVDTAPAVAGAAEALQTASQVADIIVLTNIHDRHRHRREAALAALGMPYPVLSNGGPKGKAVRELAVDRESAVLFIDDLPPQHESVAQHAPQVHRLHFVADDRLRAIIPASPHAHARIDDWSEALPYVLDILTR